MADVLQFTPTGQSLENIPHMLRYWADIIERDASNYIKTQLAILVLLQENDNKPAFCVFGDEKDAVTHPLYAAGILDYCRSQLIAVIADEESGNGAR